MRVSCVEKIDQQIKASQPRLRIVPRRLTPCRLDLRLQLWLGCFWCVLDHFFEQVDISMDEVSQPGYTARRQFAFHFVELGERGETGKRFTELTVCRIAPDLSSNATHTDMPAPSILYQRHVVAGLFRTVLTEQLLNLLTIPGEIFDVGKHTLTVVVDHPSAAFN